MTEPLTAERQFYNRLFEELSWRKEEKTEDERPELYNIYADGKEWLTIHRGRKGYTIIGNIKERAGKERQLQLGEEPKSKTYYIYKKTQKYNVYTQPEKIEKAKKRYKKWLKIIQDEEYTILTKEIEWGKICAHTDTNSEYTTEEEK